MSTAPNIAALRFVENGDQAREAIAAAANALIRSHRASPRLRVCVAGDELPAKTIAALISALRKLPPARSRARLRVSAPGRSAGRGAQALSNCRNAKASGRSARQLYRAVAGSLPGSLVDGLVIDSPP
jgi:hypothetical protein